MRNLFLLSLFFLASIKIFGQINMSDSTVQVVGYWDINETQSYIVTTEKYKIKNSDTTSREFIKYEVDITIIDSTANSYTIEWFYRDYETKNENAFIQKLMTITEDIKITIKTDEYGTVQEVINWEEIKASILKTTKLLRNEFKEIPNMDKVIQQAENMFQTKEAIEATAIKEILQFYTFHGAKYKLGQELTGQLQSPNLFGGEPFDTDIKLSLDEINPDDNNYIIRMQQSINSEQLTKATIEYLIQLAKTLDSEPPKKEDFSLFTNETWTASRIHGSGWTTFSIETREVSSEDILSVEERIIEIQ